jgi:hypothetical protein
MFLNAQPEKAEVEETQKKCWD